MNRISFFKEGDFFIYCDSGLVHEDRSNEVAGKIPARVSVEEGALLLIKDRFGQFKFLFEFADKKTTPPFITLPSHDIMEKFKHS